MFDAAISELLREHLENRIANKGAYRKYKDLNNTEEKGKNKDVEWVLSSKKTLWLYKPINSVYSARAAVKEVFFGELAVMLYGDENAPKTKFNLQHRGVLSKLISQNLSGSCDLYNFFNKDGINCNREARKQLMHTVIFNIIIENRDVRVENIVVRYSKASGYYWANKIHSIDYEFASPNPIIVPYRNCTLRDLLPLVFKDYKIFVNYMLSNNIRGLPDDAKWNLHNIVPPQQKSLIKSFTDMFTLGIEQDYFINSFKSTANRICADNYQIYDQIAKKIDERLRRQKTQVYSVDEINDQVQQIIVRQKSNMRIINQFISAYDQQHPAVKQSDLKSKCP